MSLFPQIIHFLSSGVQQEWLLIPECILYVVSRPTGYVQDKFVFDFLSVGYFWAELSSMVGGEGTRESHRNSFKTQLGSHYLGDRD